MQQSKRLFSIALILVFLTGAAFAQEPTKQGKKQPLAPSAASNPVVGSGTAGQIARWLGSDGNTFTIGNSNIFEDKFGKVGIGTKTPTSLLTVQGMIETTLGGVKFPDGTVQTSSATGALVSVAHDATLQGNGTLASPLGVAVPLNLGGVVSGAVFSAANNGNSPNGIGVQGASVQGIGVSGQSSDGDGVRGVSLGGVGVRGEGNVGVEARGNNGSGGSGGSGVRAFGGSGGISGGIGVAGAGGDMLSATGFGGDGVRAVGGIGSGAGNRGGDGIFAFRGTGIDGATNGLAGGFNGNVDVQGNLTKTMGTFKIDHPLDPENKYLYHSFVESPDMMNIYNGNITTDENGDAVVEMPDYFDALNKDFRYQLTVIGTFAQAIIASKMKGNRFIIKTNAPNVEVSWMVTGVRQDAYAEKNRVKVEEVKSERERGHYLHPEVFNQPEEKSIEWARHPEMMQKLKQQRLEAEEKSKKQQPR